MTTVSVDLASRRYSDIGIAVLSDGGSWIGVKFISPSELGLTGVPDARILANKLSALALEKGARLIILDGPQGWSANATPPKIMRDCERAARTPGKTGLPGCVKPKTFLQMAEFSIAVFDALHSAGWLRFEGDLRGDRRSIESFPTCAWRMLGLNPLPSKKHAMGRIEDWVAVLNERTAIRWSRSPNHDELQAAVAGLVGVLMERHGVKSCTRDGSPPFMENGLWREGFIVSPSAFPEGQ